MKKTTLYDSNYSPSKIRGGQGALKLLIIPLLAMLVLASCTRNHGDIGIWFGTWHVEQITAGGTPVIVEGDYFFQFQSHVFRVSNVGAHEQVVESYGSWQENEGGKMAIDFPDASVYYIVMPGLESHNDFTVTTTSSSDVTFTKTDATGTPYTYHLRKQP